MSPGDLVVCFRPCRKTNIDGLTAILEEREHAHSCP